MLVKDIMSQPVKTAHLNDTLENTAIQMKEFNMGFIPVVDEQDKVTNVITDRDILLRSAIDPRPLSQLKAKDITKHYPLCECLPSDDVAVALNTMRTRQLHRLPVVDESGKIMGVLGLADILKNTQEGNANMIQPSDTLETLKSIYSSTHH